MTIEERRDAARELISEGEDLLKEIEQELLNTRRDATTLTIQEGKYYLTRKGKVRGPMRPLPETGCSGYKWTDSAKGDVIYGNIWTDEGFYLIDEPEPNDSDLVAERP